MQSGQKSKYYKVNKHHQHHINIGYIVAVVTVAVT